MRSALSYLLAFLMSASLAQADQVTVFAAASLKTALDEIAVSFGAETGTTVTLSYAGSSALARQIERGAPADVFFSANTAWMDVLDRQGLLAPDTRTDLLGNRLVLVAGHPSEPEMLSPDTDLLSWLDGGKLAMALTEAVPAGQYGKAALTHLELWTDVAPYVAQTDNVRAALSLVAIGAAPLGVVYATDARADPRVHIRGTFPDASQPKITYPVAAVAGRAPQAAPFLDHLTTPAAQEIFRRNGFIVLAE